jgi:cation diffusion facilitator family transporter
MKKDKEKQLRRRDLTPRVRIIQRASIIGIIGNALLSASKLIAGFFGNSLALLGDGIDSLTDVVTSTVTLYTARIADKPPDLTHPYGHGRAETIATKVLSLVILFAGAQLLISSVEHLVFGSERELPRTYALLVAGVSVAGKVFLAVNKYRAGKRADSSMLIADAKNMSMDVLISLSVLLGLFFTIRLDLPILDSIIALAVGAWIIKVGFGIFMETSVELMDSIEDRTVYVRVCRAASSVEGIHNPHKMRIRRINTKLLVDMDVEVSGELSVQQGHELVMEVQRRIHEAVAEVYDVHIHMEPLGNEESRERFGLSSYELFEERRRVDRSSGSGGCRDEEDEGAE